MTRLGTIAARCLDAVTAVLLALVLACALPAGLLGQFNGPADTARDTVNAPHTLTTDPAILYPPARLVRLQTGDNLRVSLYGVADYTTLERIAADGRLSLPLIDPVPLEGLTVLEAQLRIAEHLQAAGMFVKPQVHVEIVDSPKSVITVIGEVHSSVAAPTGSRRLFDVLAQTGLPPTVSHLISIDRPGLAESINIDVGTDPEKSKYANIPIFAGDTIATSNIGHYYLLGAFRQQGVFPLSNTAPLTLVQMVATGGGRLFEAQLDKVHIIRTIGTQRTVVTVDLKAALKGTAPDPVIENDDIIVAPTNLLRSAIRNGGLTTVFGIALTAITLIRN